MGRSWKWRRRKKNGIIFRWANLRTLPAASASAVSTEKCSACQSRSTAASLIFSLFEKHSWVKSETSVKHGQMSLNNSGFLSNKIKARVNIFFWIKQISIFSLQGEDPLFFLPSSSWYKLLIRMVWVPRLTLNVKKSWKHVRSPDKWVLKKKCDIWA